jgi:bacteriocin-like protein
MKTEGMILENSSLSTEELNEVSGGRNVRQEESKDITYDGGTLDEIVVTP